jgi:hypothetical protein
MKNYLTKTATLIASTMCLTAIASTFSPSSIGKSEPQIITFTENKGQVVDQRGQLRTDVLFSGKSNDMTYHLKRDGISYQLSRIDTWMKQEDQKTKTETQVPSQTTVYRLDINWIGVNANCKIDLDTEIDGINNYYSKTNPNGIQNVKTYEGIVFKNIYNDIDLHYYKSNNLLKYDYIVAANSDYRKIKFEVKGANEIKIQNDGSVLYKTPLGNIEDGTPIVYQNGNQLKAKWILEDNILSFKIENVDPNNELVIDPGLRVWGTYYSGTNPALGGAESTSGAACTTDVSGNIYLTGSTTATISIATSGSFQSTINSFGGGFSDHVYLVKFNSSGTRQWATYYGGDDNHTYVWDCKTDASGNIFICGNTLSTTLISSSGAQQSAIGGLSDAFLVKFNSSGLRQWGTYFGGALNDYGYACAVDNLGNIYMSGTTFSSSAIATVGSFQSSLIGSANLYFVKYNTSGVKQWGTYYGLGSEDGGYCATDNSGNAYLTGSTFGGAGLTTAGCHQSVYGGAATDGLLIKWNSAGGRVWATYYGGNGFDASLACTTDPLNNVYIAGYTFSNSALSIATTGSHQAAYSGSGHDGFLAKFNTSGVRQWGTYYGGTVQTDRVYSCASDAGGNIIICGITGTSSGTIIATTGSQQSTYGGIQDAFIAEFNNGGTRQWGSYYGGVSLDYGSDCCTDLSGNVYLCGSTNSPTNIASAGSFQSTKLSTGTGYLAKFCNTTPVSPLQSSILLPNCGGDPTTLKVIASGTVKWYNVTTGGAVLFTGSSYTLILANGTYTYYAENITSCGTSTRTPITFTVNAGIGCRTLNLEDSIESIYESINIYPNPNKGNFSIDLNIDSKVIIYDTFGKEIFNKYLNSGNQNISLFDINKGIYILKLVNVNGQLTKKIIISD